MVGTQTAFSPPCSVGVLTVCLHLPWTCACSFCGNSYGSQGGGDDACGSATSGFASNCADGASSCDNANAVYETLATDGWAQVGGDLRKCPGANSNTAQTIEESLADCKAQATARGHNWASFKTGPGHCFTAEEDDCSEDTLSTTSGNWAVHYRSAAAGEQFLSTPFAPPIPLIPETILENTRECRGWVPCFHLSVSLHPTSSC